jgi:hypothetical protein
MRSLNGDASASQQTYHFSCIYKTFLDNAFIYQQQNNQCILVNFMLNSIAMV